MPKKLRPPTPSQKLASAQKLAKNLNSPHKTKPQTLFKTGIEGATIYRRAGYELWHGAKKVNILGLKTMEPVKIIRNGIGEAQGLIAMDYPQLQENEIKNQHKGNIHLIYYPKVTDMKVFRKGAAVLNKGAPGRIFLGAVGSIRVTLSIEEKTPIYEIKYIQAHYRSGTKQSPPRGLITKYGGWRHKILEHVFEEAKKNKARVEMLQLNPSWLAKDLANFPKGLSEANKKNVQKNLTQTREKIKMFKEAAKKAGLMVIEELSGTQMQIKLVAQTA